MMIVHLARKILYGVDLPLKVGIYIVSSNTVVEEASACHRQSSILDN